MQKIYLSKKEKVSVSDIPTIDSKAQFIFINSGYLRKKK